MSAQVRSSLQPCSHLLGFLRAQLLGYRSVQRWYRVRSVPRLERLHDQLRYTSASPGLHQLVESNVGDRPDASFATGPMSRTEQTVDWTETIKWR